MAPHDHVHDNIPSHLQIILPSLEVAMAILSQCHDLSSPEGTGQFIEKNWDILTVSTAANLAWIRVHRLLYPEPISASLHLWKLVLPALYRVQIAPGLGLVSSTCKLHTSPYCSSDVDHPRP